MPEEYARVLLKELIEKIGIDKILNDKIAIFCGAGISRLSGLPMADQLETSILNSINMNQGNIDKVKSKIGPFEAFMQTIADFIDISDLIGFFNMGIPDIDHHLIAKMAKKGILRIILTTNFDDCIEKALEQEGLKLDKDYITLYKEENFEKFEQYERDNRILLVKIHGSAHDPVSVRTTLRQIASKDLSVKRKMVLESIFTKGEHRNIMVIGYSCSDIFDISPALEGIEEASKSVLFINHSNGTKIEMEDIKTQTEKNPFKRYNGLRIKIDTNNFVKALLILLDSYNVIDEPVVSVKWERYVENFFKNVKKLDPTLYLTFCGEYLKSIMELRQAISYHHRALEASKQLGLAYNIARSSTHLGNCYGALGDLEKAIKFHTDALSIAIANNASDKIIETRSNLAGDYFSSGNYRKGFELIKENIAFSEKIMDKHNLAGSYEMMGQFFSYTGNTDAAIKHHRDALKLAEELGELGLQISSLGNIAGAYKVYGKYEKSMEYYKMALKISKEIGSSAEITRCCMSIGSCYKMMGNPQEALKWLEQAKEIALGIADKQQLGYCFKEMGSCHLDLGNYNGCLSFYQRALSIYEEINDNDNMARILGDIGVFYMRNNQIETSKEYYLKAFQVAKNTESDATISWLYANLGGYYRKAGDTKKALEYYHRSLELAKKVGDQEQEAGIYNSYSDLFFDLGKYDESFKYSMKYLEMIRNMGNLSKEMAAYFDLSERYLRKGDVPNSQIYFEKGKQISIGLGRNDFPLSYLLRKINFLVESGNIVEAKKYSDEALYYYNLTENKEVKGAIMMTLSKLCIEGKEYAKGLEYAKNSIGQISDGISLTNLMRANLNAGLCEFGVKDTNGALMYFKKAEKIAKSLKDDTELLRIQAAIRDLVEANMD